MVKIGDTVAKGKAKVREAKKALKEANEALDDANRRIKIMRISIAALTKQAAKNVKTAQNRLDRTRKRAADNVAKARKINVVLIGGDDTPPVQIITHSGRPGETAQVEEVPFAPEKKRRGRPRKVPKVEDTQPAPEKKRRGRPRKTPGAAGAPPQPPAPGKKRRGRPRKKPE